MSETEDRVTIATKGDHRPKVLNFPEDYEQTAGLWIRLTELFYSRPSVGAQPDFIPTGTQIALPIPMSLGAGYTAMWDTEEFGALHNSLINAARSPGAQETVKGFLKDPMQFIHNQFNTSELVQKIKEKKYNEAFDSVVDTVAPVKAWMLNEGASAAMSDFAMTAPLFRPVLQSMGVARNPWLAATFQGVGFRSFPFEYKFVCKSYNESVKLNQIIDALKYGMHPAYSEEYANNLFKYPNMYDVAIIPTNEFLFDFAICIIKDINVQYHSEGSPIYFEHQGKKIPASVTLSFTLQEIEVNTKETINPGRAGTSYTDPTGDGNATTTDGNPNVIGAVTSRKYGKVIVGR